MRPIRWLCGHLVVIAGPFALARLMTPDPVTAVAARAMSVAVRPEQAAPDAGRHAGLLAGHAAAGRAPRARRGPHAPCPRRRNGPRLARR